VRRIPMHEIAVFDGCKVDDIEAVVREILEAIDNGAPLYNDSKHEACFRIYEGVAVKFERDMACKGVRGAFGDVLLKVAAQADYKTKAWAMRDTFDGLLIAAKKWTAAPIKPSKK